MTEGRVVDPIAEEPWRYCMTPDPCKVNDGTVWECPCGRRFRSSYCMGWTAEGHRSLGEIGYYSWRRREFPTHLPKYAAHLRRSPEYLMPREDMREAYQ